MALTDESNKDYQYVRTIEEKYKRKLLDIDGVEGVGIGMRGKRHVIVVNVSRISSEIPTIIDGVPVRINYTDTIKPL